MAESYFKPTETYPLILKSAFETYRKYLAEMLYTEDRPEEAIKRIIRANIGDSDDTARNAAENFKKTNYPLPYTAYNIDEPEIDDKRLNYFGRSGDNYVPELDCYITTIPYKVKVNLISFFPTVFDYNLAMTKLRIDFASLTRLYFLVKINGRLTKHSFNILMDEPTKGKYAFEFQEMLRVGQISDILHPLTIEYNEILINISKHTELTVYPVDEVILEFFDPVSGTFIDPPSEVPIPKISQVRPADGKDGVHINSDIQILFSTEMDPNQIFSDGIEVNPIFDYTYELDSTKKLLTITPTNELNPLSCYRVNIDTNLISNQGAFLGKSCEFVFKTGKA